MFLDITIDYYKITFALIFILVFVIAYYVILGSRFENLFKQGKIWQIRIGQILLAFIVAYFITQGLMLILPSF